MKKPLKRIVSFAIFVFIAVMLYYNTPYHITKYNWKCMGEGRINDFHYCPEKSRHRYS